MTGFEMIVRSIALGAGLAMDAFSVSLANGLRESRMPFRRMCGTAGVYAFFQFLMPIIGWLCVTRIVRAFSVFEALVPWIAFILLLFIGIRMLLGGIRENRQRKSRAEESESQAQAERIETETIDQSGDAEQRPISLWTLILQGVATSIDALSVGFAFARYDWKTAVLCAIIIGTVTFLICLPGLAIGKKIGTRLAGSAEIAGGAILIVIGVEIFVKGMFF